MGFCTKSMNMMATQKDREQVINNKTAVMQTHVNICSCIIDRFRIEQDESAFKKEFTANGTAADVPIFAEYFSYCTQINNNIQIFNNGL